MTPDKHTPPPAVRAADDGASPSLITENINNTSYHQKLPITKQKGHSQSYGY